MAKRSQNGSTGSPSRAKSRESQKPQTNLPELIVVTFAENMEQAKEYETLLAANGIPATIKEQGADTDGVAVMVPEDYLDEAHVVIESQDAYDDFYDFALEEEEEDESDFDSELFEDDL